jgi:hypothetical protein
MPKPSNISITWAATCGAYIWPLWWECLRNVGELRPGYWTLQKSAKFILNLCTSRLVRYASLRLAADENVVSTVCPERRPFASLWPLQSCHATCSPYIHHATSADKPSTLISLRLASRPEHRLPWHSALLPSTTAGPQALALRLLLPSDNRRGRCYLPHSSSLLWYDDMQAVDNCGTFRRTMIRTGVVHGNRRCQSHSPTGNVTQPKLATVCLL